MARPLLTSPEHWLRATLEPDATLGLIIRADSGGTPSTTESTYWDGDIPWLTPKDISNHVDRILVSSTERMLTRKGLLNSGSKLFAPGTVMLTKRTPVGLVAINAASMATNQGFLNFECGPMLRPLYLAYGLKRTAHTWKWWRTAQPSGIAMPVTCSSLRLRCPHWMSKTRFSRS